MTQQPGFQRYGDPGHGDQPFGNQPAPVGPDERTFAALAPASSLIAMVLSAGRLSFGTLRATKGRTINYPFHLRVLR